MEELQPGKDPTTLIRWLHAFTQITSKMSKE